MKRLAILRHAKASPGEPGLDDFDRPLNDRGRKDAQALGRELGRRGLTFDHALASPAQRVRETLEELAKGYGSPLDIRFDHRNYLAPAATLLDRVRELPQEVERPLLVGHNPGLQELLVALSGDDARGFHARVAQGYPAAALAIVEFPAANWAGIEAGSGEIVELIVPGERD